MTKQELRQKIKEKRAAIDADTKKQLDTAILKQIAQSEVFLSASSLLIYAPSKGEINLLPLVRLARERGIPVGFPRCDTATTTIQFYELEAEKRLVMGAYNIPEPPADAPLCPVDEHTLCILPGLTFDPMGGRLGYGKGYYDRFLTTFPGVRAAAVYESLLVKRVPTEEHDRPVALLFTEHECWDCRKAPPPPQKKKASHYPAWLESGATRLYTWLSKKKGKTGRTAQSIAIIGQAPERPPLYEKTLHLPAILVAASYLLLLISGWIGTAVTDPTWERVTVILAQLLIFLIPCAVYVFRFRGKTFLRELQPRLPRLSHLWFLACMLVVMITAGLLTEIMTGGISSLTGNFTLYNTFVARAKGTGEIIFLILAYCLLPAVCEELVFRGILCAEYNRYGAVISITVSALFFAMLHFSFALFLTYFVLGALLAAVWYTTRSLLATVLLHFLYNLFCLFGQPYLSAFYVRAGSTEIFLFCLIALFLLFAAFASGEGRKIYHVYAKKHPEDNPAVVPWQKLPQQFLVALLSPAVGACIALWLIATLLQ